MAVADMNQDGRADIVVGRIEGGFSILLNQGGGAFVRTDIGYFFAVTDLAVGDLNGDGRADVVTVDGRPDVVASSKGGNTVYLFRGNGNGTLQPPAALDTGVEPSDLVAADMNGDGRADIVTVNAAGATATVLASNESGTFTRTYVPIGGNPIALRVGDVDGDGLPDIIAADSNGAVSWSRGPLRWAASRRRWYRRPRST